MAKKKEIGNLSLNGYNQLFDSTIPTAQAPDTTGERVVEISLAELHPPEFHPFQVNDVLCCKGYKNRAYKKHRQTQRLRGNRVRNGRIMIWERVNNDLGMGLLIIFEKGRFDKRKLLWYSV